MVVSNCMIEMNTYMYNYLGCHGANSFRPNQFYRIIKIDGRDKWATETTLNNSKPSNDSYTLCIVCRLTFE